MTSETIREAMPADTDEIISVCSAALGWSDPAFDEALFRWKHFDNAFGRSLVLVAVDGGRIVAVRPFMRWRFRDGNDVVTAARAVDTATHPSAQGRGLFRRLTEAGLEMLHDEGTAFVFNTPNDKSRPGYLKMGWRTEGPVAFGFGARSPLSLPRLLRSRAAADKPSIPTVDLGVSIEEGLDKIDASNVAPGAADFMRTDHTIETLRWRFGGGPIVYRFLPTPTGLGGVIVRLRKRAMVRELVAAHAVGAIDETSAGSLVRGAMRQTQADLYIAPDGFPRTVSIPRLGPTLTTRTVIRDAPISRLSWQPGDIELF